MLIFANGARKSGSTWQMHIALQVSQAAEPPDQYHAATTQTRPVFAVNELQLAAFLNDPQLKGRTTLIKQHFGKPAQRDLLLKHPQVRVLNMRRDIRDVTVSYYHHWQLTRQVTLSYDEYYREVGRQHVWQVLCYQVVWAVRSPRYLCQEYEQMRRDPHDGVRRIAQFLDVELSESQLEQIVEQTSGPALNRKYPPSGLNRFRNGVGGEWHSVLSPDHIADIAALQRAARNPLLSLALHAPAALRRRMRGLATIPPQRSDSRNS